MTRGRNALFALVLGASLLSMMTPGVAAQDDAPATGEPSVDPGAAEAPGEPEAPDTTIGSAVVAFSDADEKSDDAISDEETEARIRRIVIALVAIGVAALALTALFWYHTIPSRRVIAARRRRARENGGQPANGASRSRRRDGRSSPARGTT